MRDVGIFTPTRFRLANAQRLIDSVAATAVLKTDLILAIDDDDYSYADLKCGPNVSVVRGPRRTCGQWTNDLAREFGGQYRTLASFGDDHEPDPEKGYGWDAALLGAIDEMGGTGIAYGNDTHQGANLPTAPVISSDIPAALGWFFLPGLRYFADNVWKDLGERLGCLAYLPQVTIRHYHYMFGTAPRDATYAEAEPGWNRDQARYEAWRRDELPGCAAKIRTLLS